MPDVTTIQANNSARPISSTLPFSNGRVPQIIVAPKTEFAKSDTKLSNGVAVSERLTQSLYSHITKYRRTISPNQGVYQLPHNIVPPNSINSSVITNNDGTDKLSALNGRGAFATSSYRIPVPPSDANADYNKAKTVNAVKTVSNLNPNVETRYSDQQANAFKKQTDARKLAARTAPCVMHHHKPDQMFSINQKENLPEFDFYPAYNTSSVETQRQKSFSDYGTCQNALVPLAALVVLDGSASVLAILSLQLVLSLLYYQSTASPIVVRGSMHDVALTMACVSLTFSLCTMFLCSVQLGVCLRCATQQFIDQQPYARMIRYLRQSSYLRFVAVAGFYISFPMFLISVLLSTYVFGDLFDRFLTSAIFTGVAVTGAFLCLAVVSHAIYVWYSGPYYGQWPLKQHPDRFAVIKTRARDRTNDLIDSVVRVSHLKPPTIHQRLTANSSVDWPPSEHSLSTLV